MIDSSEHINALYWHLDPGLVTILFKDQYIDKNNIFIEDP